MAKARTVTKVEGRLDAHSVYTADEIMRAIGMGSVTLAEARRSGMVKPVEIHPRLLYFGDEILAWLRHRRDEQENS